MKKAIIIFTLLLIQIGLFAKIKDVKGNDELVIIHTNYGNIKLELYPKSAPRAVANFKNLARQGFYDSTYFHRVIPDFMIQGGDPNTKDNDRSNDGTGGPGYTFKDEINADTLGLDTLLVKNSILSRQFPPNHPYQLMSVKTVYEKQGYTYTKGLPSKHNEYGSISMANSGPNTNGSQFFIIVRENGTPWLDGKHTVFGKVVEGMDVVEKIAHLKRDERDNPLPENKAVIEKITFQKKQKSKSK